MTLQPNQPSLVRWLPHIIPLVLAVMTLGVLLLNTPDSDLISRYSNEILTYVFLTAFVLFFGVWFSEGELSPAHAVGMIAFLSLPLEARPLMTWAVFFGGVAGAGLHNVRIYSSRRLVRHRLLNIVFVTARVTLGFWTASQVYFALDGVLPIFNAEWETKQYYAAFLYTLVYVTLYFSVFVLEIYGRGQAVREIVRANLMLILVTMLLPVPFSFMIAEIVNQLSKPTQVIGILGMPVIVLALHAISRSEFQLHKQLNELRTLSIVTRAVRSHLQLETLLKTVYLQVSNLLDIRNFTVALYNPESNQVEFPLVIRDGDELHPEDQALILSTTNSLITRVIDDQTPIIIGDNVQETVQNMGLELPEETIYSWMGIPLIAGGKRLGMFAVTSDDPHRHFDQNDLRLFSIVAASASVAIENAQLYHQQTERLQQMIALNNISALLAGTLSPDSVLDTIISSTSAISQGNAVAVYLFGQDEAMPTMVRHAGLSLGFSNNPPEPLLVTCDTAVPMHQKLPLPVQDILTDTRISHLRRQFELEGKRAYVEMPLVIGESSLGIIVAYYNEVQLFTSEQLERLRTFATQAAQSIRNAQTYSSTDQALQRSIERLLTLAGIGRVLTSTVDLVMICNQILQSAMEACHVEVGIVGLSSADGIDVMAHAGYEAPTIIRESITYHVLETGQTRVIDDVSQEPTYRQVIASTRSQLSVPISRGDTILGVITLESDRIGGFSLEDSQFVSQIANQSVIAIDNARLFKRIIEGRDRLQVILDAMDEGIILIDSQDEIVLANPAMTMVGIEPGTLLNQHLEELVNEQHAQVYERLGFDTRHDFKGFVDDLKQGVIDYEPILYSIEGEQGIRYIQRIIIAVPGAERVLLVFHDRTEEQELERARDELSRMMVHDLRSPLTAVNTGMKLLNDLVPEESDFSVLVKSTTETSRRAIRKLLGRVDSLLDISKMESGRIEVETELAELNAIVDNVFDELTPLANELNIELVSAVSADLLPLDIDTDKVERLLLNLVDNALKYSPQASQIIVRHHLPGEANADKGFVRIDVVDSGPGIPDDFKLKLFDSFTQVEGRKKVRRGVGLGLAFCRLVADAHQGRIWVEDNPSGGSVFAVTLPVAKMERLPEDEF